jgi:hypothetical protein
MLLSVQQAPPAHFLRLSPFSDFSVAMVGVIRAGLVAGLYRDLLNTKKRLPCQKTQPIERQRAEAKLVHLFSAAGGLMSTYEVAHLFDVCQQTASRWKQNLSEKRNELIGRERAGGWGSPWFSRGQDVE